MRERIQLAPNSKVPAVKGSWNTSTDLQEVSSWIGDGYNIGLVMDGITGIDYDAKEPARDFFRKYRELITVGWETRKGVHFLFDGETQPRKFEHGDIKSGPHSYLVCPPSPNYNLFAGNIDKTELKPLPEEFKQKKVQVQKEIGDTRAYIYGVFAESGKKGHNSTFKVACLLRDAGYSESETLAALIEWNETNANPRWRTKELLHKTQDAFKKGTHDASKAG
jgi:hypothetical protein